MRYHVRRRAILVSVVVVVGLCASAGVARAQNPPEEVEYYATDALGSVRIVFTPTGQVLGRSDYLPFGETLNQTGSLPRQRFTGQERDGEAGLDYFNARDLQARTGRMNAPDPLFGDAVANPQRWNRYAYGANNPLRLVDPTGMEVQLPDVADLGWRDWDDMTGYLMDWKPSAFSYGMRTLSAAGFEFSMGGGGSIYAKADFGSLIPDVVKQVISKAVADSNAPNSQLACMPAGSQGPCQQDAKGGQHETGGIWGPDQNGYILVSPAKPGGLCDAAGCSIWLSNAEDPSVLRAITDYVGGFHIHPSGSLPSGQPYPQEPSEGVDRAHPGFRINLVVGAGNQQVYLYTDLSIAFQMSLKDLLR